MEQCHGQNAALVPVPQPVANERNRKNTDNKVKSEQWVGPQDEIMVVTIYSEQRKMPTGPQYRKDKCRFKK